MCFTAFGLTMDIWHCLKEQKKDKMPLPLGSKDITCLLGIKMKDICVLPEVKKPYLSVGNFSLQILFLP